MRANAPAFVPVGEAQEAALARAESLLEALKHETPLVRSAAARTANTGGASGPEYFTLDSDTEGPDQDEQTRRSSTQLVDWKSQRPTTRDFNQIASRFLDAR